MIITRHRLKKVIFWVVLTTGVGLCIAGIFVPILLLPGAACMTAVTAISRIISDTRLEEAPREAIEILPENVFINLESEPDGLLFSHQPSFDEDTSDSDQNEPRTHPESGFHRHISHPD